MVTATQNSHLAFLRRARGWSQTELASRAGLSRNTVEMTEAGRTPRRSTRLKLAAVFEVDPEALFPTTPKD